MGDREEIMRRMFVVAYTKVFIEELYWVSKRYCPLGRNYIDEEKQTYVYRPYEDSNFRSWAAYRLHSWEAHVRVNRGDVKEFFSDELAEYDLEEFIDEFFIDHFDPFRMVQTVWRDDFDMCLHELLQ
jgi:hypothetical protein